MVGRELDEARRLERDRRRRASRRSSSTDVWVAGDRGDDARARCHASTCCAGEIVAVAGVAGNGQRELAEIGRRDAAAPRAAGRASHGKPLRGGDAREAIRAGVAHVPEDRLHTGVAPSLSIASNTVLKAYRDRGLSAGPMLRLGVIRDARRAS